MATADPILLAQIKRDEGCVLTAYRDRNGVWTIGWGHTGKEVHAGLVWAQAQADDQLSADIERLCGGLLKAQPWIAKLSPVRQRVLQNMAFNLGIQGLLEFRRTLLDVRDACYNAAAHDMLLSRWALEVGARAKRLSAAMASDVEAEI